MSAQPYHNAEAMNRSTHRPHDSFVENDRAHDDFALEALYQAEAQAHGGEATPNSAAHHRSFHLASYLTGLLTALLLVGATSLALRRPDLPAIVLQPPPTLAPTATPLPTATAAPLVVFVSGAVQQPGIYEIAQNGRVGDALRAAGGLTLQANVALINQAERLWDGAQIHVPTASIYTPSLADEVAATVPAEEPPAGLSGSGTQPTGRTGLAPSSSGLININLASPTELEQLPGIGASKAAAIVANRPYTSIDDLERVPGIGAKTLDQLRPLVTIE